MRLLEHNEEYVFTMPSAYARSILSVPWAEMGDKITIACAKTNFTSNVTFHTKVGYRFNALKFFTLSQNTLKLAKIP